jgi:uncharacterized heparinase superfamily protein
MLAVEPSRRVAGMALGFTRDWVGSGPRAKTHPAWQSYTVSERIVHWVLFLLLARDRVAVAECDQVAIHESLVKQADYLLENLEYHGPDRTNNHLLNNGRALYMAGVFVGSARHISAGRTILAEESAARFSPSGFLAEGSSHYHLLLTRTLLEVLWMARLTDDLALCRALEGPTARALRCARFFFPRQDSPLPLMGDVSPDFPPDWLAGLPTLAFHRGTKDGETPAPFSTGWHSLWGNSGTAVPWVLPENLPPDVQPSRGILAFPDAGWYQCVTAVYAIFWRAAAPGSVIESCHAHHDLGSFELHAQGYPVVVDPGRATYQPARGGHTWRSARSHNTVVVDGQEPSVTRGFNGHAAFLETYARAHLEVRWTGGGSLREFAVRHDGFKRLPGLGTWTRRFLLSEGSVKVVDRLQGEGCHRIETFFHLHPDVDARQDIPGRTVRCEHPKGSLRIEHACESLQSVELCRMGAFEDGGPAGRFSPRYGVVVPAWSIRFHQVIRLPAESVFELRLE